MAASYAPAAKFIKLAKQEFPSAQFLILSFAGNKALLDQLDKQTQNIIVTQVVPHFHSDLPVASEYLNDFSLLNPSVEPGFISFEGYIVAKILVEAIKAIEGPISRSKVSESLEKLKSLDIGLGIEISLHNEIHQAVNKIWPMKIENGEFVPIEWELRLDSPDLVSSSNTLSME